VGARTHRRSAELVARALIILLGAMVVYALLPFLSGFVGAAVLAIAVSPAHERLSLHLGRRTSAVLTTIGAVLLVLIPGAALVLSLLGQAPDVLRAITQSSLLRELSTVRLAGIDIGSVADTAVTTLLSWVSSRAGALISRVTLATLNIVVAIVGLYYLLITHGAPWREVSRHLPFSATTVELLATRFRTTTESMILGVVLTAIAQGTVVGGAFAITGLPNALFWGVVTACASILPVLGSSLVWMPGTLVLFADRRYGAAVTLGVIGVVIASQIDNLIRPLIYRRVSRIHPMITLVGAFAGLRIFGFAGLLLGPLGISYLIELVHAYSIEFGNRAPLREPDIATAAD
jgi:predicted PurR-regulated permease PerM